MLIHMLKYFILGNRRCCISDGHHSTTPHHDAIERSSGTYGQLIHCRKPTSHLWSSYQTYELPCNASMDPINISQNEAR